MGARHDCASLRTNLVRLIYLDETGNTSHATFLSVAGVILHADYEWPAVDERSGSGVYRSMRATIPTQACVYRNSLTHEKCRSHGKRNPDGAARKATAFAISSGRPLWERVQQLHLCPLARDRGSKEGASAGEGGSHPPFRAVLRRRRKMGIRPGGSGPKPAHPCARMGGAFKNPAVRLGGSMALDSQLLR